MRNFVLFLFASAIVLGATLAHAQQQIDLAVGGSTLASIRSPYSTVGYVGPTERGGIYPSASVQMIFSNHFGVNAEGAFHYHQALYNGFQRYRPTFYDVNAVYATRVTNKIRADAIAGIGGSTVFFYDSFGSCAGQFAGGCLINSNTTHFMEHVGGDLRYYFFRSLFVRPEIHYYHIQNNTNIFSSNNVIRVGASIGFSLVPH